MSSNISKEVTVEDLISKYEQVLDDLSLIADVAPFTDLHLESIVDTPKKYVKGFLEDLNNLGDQDATQEVK